jgi:hypothetical protein
MKTQQKKSTRNLPKSPNFGAFDLGLERTSELAQGGKSTGTDLDIVSTPLIGCLTTN